MLFFAPFLVQHYTVPTMVEKDKLLLGPFGIVLRSIQAFFYGTLTIECATTSPEDGALAINIARETT